MPLPPVIERELRGASRRSMTYWTRLMACAAGILIIVPFVLMVEIGARFGNQTIPIQELGPMFFGLFSALAFVTAIAAGWFFATDAIALERREGTLELLFLAPLKPWEVVLGKLVTVTWRGAQWLLAAIPLFALPILLGGVGASDLVRLACVTANTLLWSVGTSLWASARSRGIFEALVTTAILQGCLIVLPFLADLSIARFGFSRFEARASLLSPVLTWSRAFSSGSNQFWPSFAVVHAEIWILLALTVRATAHQVRQDPSTENAGIFSRINTVWKYGRPSARQALRRRLIELQPIRWLVERERGPARFLTALPLILVLTVLGVSLAVQEPAALVAAGSVGIFLLSIAITILLALQSSRFLVEARRTGALELLLVSPLSTRTILDQQVRSLIRTFALAIGVLMAAQVAVALGQQSLMGQMPPIPATATATATAGAGPNSPGAVFGVMVQYQWLTVLVGTVVSLTGFVAVAWVGFWMGMASRQVAIALFATIAIAKLIPMFAVGFAQASVLSLVLSNRVPAWFPAVFSGLCGVGLHLGLVLLARYQLLPDLRRIVGSPSSFILPSPRPRKPPILPR